MIVWVLGIIVIGFFLIGLFELIMRLERLTSRKFTWKETRSVELTETNVDLTGTKVKPKALTPEEKALSADKKLAGHKQMIENSAMDADAKLMASRHAEGKHLTSLKDLIDGS